MSTTRPDDTELPLTWDRDPIEPTGEPRVWKVRFTYLKYIRYRGVMVDKQVRDEKEFHGRTQAEARQACRDWLGNQMVAEFDSYGRTIANIANGQDLTRCKTLNIIEVNLA